jgi:hypothetical protein
MASDSAFFRSCAAGGSNIELIRRVADMSAHRAWASKIGFRGGDGGGTGVGGGGGGAAAAGEAGGSEYGPLISPWDSTNAHK